MLMYYKNLNMGTSFVLKLGICSLLSFPLPGFIPVTGRVEVPPYNFIGVNDTLFDATYANLACPSGLSTCTGTAVSSCTAYGGFLTILCAISEYLIDYMQVVHSFIPSYRTS